MKTFLSTRYQPSLPFQKKNENGIWSRKMNRLKIDVAITGKS